MPTIYVTDPRFESGQVSAYTQANWNGNAPSGAAAETVTANSGVAAFSTLSYGTSYIFAQQRSSGSWQFVSDTPTDPASGGGGGTGPTGPAGPSGTLAAPLGMGFIKPVVGRYYDQSLVASASGTFVAVAGSLRLFPFITPTRLTIDQLGLNVTAAAAAAALAKVVIYAAGADGLPAARLYDSGSILAIDTTGFKNATPTFTFEPNTLYWLGHNQNGTPTYSSIGTGSQQPFSLSSQTGTAYNSAVVITAALDSEPNPAGVVPATHFATSAQATSMRFRVASIG